MLLRLLLDTKTRQKWAETALKALFLPEGQKSLSRSPQQELEVGLRSGPYLLVVIVILIMVVFSTNTNNNTSTASVSISISNNTITNTISSIINNTNM